VRAQAACVVDGAAGNDETHGNELNRAPVVTVSVAGKPRCELGTAGTAASLRRRRERG
jgi:hypothetical protein